MDVRRSLGNEGESIAADYLRAKGYVVAARQHRTPFGEIDIVALDGKEVVFVEVKTRQDTTFGFPEEAVTPQKIAHVAAAGQAFLQERAWDDRPFRIDIIAILLPPGEDPKIEHLEGVDGPGGY
jgi:putative endonuclease